MDNLALFGLVYIAPYAVSYVLCKEKPLTYLGLAIATFALSCISMPIGFFVPWVLIPVFGITRYFPYKEEPISTRLLLATAIAAAALAIASTLLLDFGLEVNSVKHLSELGPFFILPLFLSGMETGNAFAFGQYGYFFGVFIEFFLIWIFLLLILSAGLRGKCFK